MLRFVQPVIIAALGIGLGINFLADNSEASDNVNNEELSSATSPIYTAISSSSGRIDATEARIGQLESGIAVVATKNGDAWELAAGIAKKDDVPSELASLLNALESQLDGDGFLWSDDACPNLLGEVKEGDYKGCPTAATVDADKDGVNDLRDSCAGTPEDNTETKGVDESSVIDDGYNSGWRSQIFANADDGCSDLDEDGVTEHGGKDVCPNSKGEDVNAKGCLMTEIVQTCTITVSSEDADDGKSGKVRYSGCAGADDPAKTFEFAWSEKEEGEGDAKKKVTTFGPPTEYVASVAPPAPTGPLAPGAVGTP